MGIQLHYLSNLDSLEKLSTFLSLSSYDLVYKKLSIEYCLNSYFAGDRLRASKEA